MTGQSPLRVGVAGLGWFGRIHLDAWSVVRGAVVVGVCDRDPRALEVDSDGGSAAQEGFHADAGGGYRQVVPAGARRHSSVEELVRSGIDLLDVVVTEAEHERCVRLALEAGIDVIVEKPLALHADAAAELVLLAADLGRRLYVAQVLRFEPRHVALAELVRGRRLRHLSMSRHFQVSAHNVYGRVHPVLNAAVHDVDLAIWLVGGAPNRVTAFASHFLRREHPDAVDLVLEWGDDLRAVLQNSWHLAASCPYGFTFDCTVHGVDGTHVVRNEPVLQSWTAAGVTAPELFFWPRYAGVRSGALVAELQHFADCASRRIPSSRVPLCDVLDVMSTCRAAMESLRTGQSAAVRSLARSAHPRPGGRP